MVAWAEANHSVWNHYFAHVSTNRAVYDIKDGKVSPWLLLNCNSGKALLAKFNDEQLGLVFHILNPGHWAMRFKRQPSDVALVKSIAKQGNL